MVIIELPQMRAGANTLDGQPCVLCGGLLSIKVGSGLFTCSHCGQAYIAKGWDDRQGTPHADEP